MVNIDNFVERIKEINESRFPKGTPTISVSRVIEELHEKFEKEKQAQRCFEKYFEDQSSKYYHMTAEDILEQWDNKATASKKYGIMSDNYIEFRTNGHSELERPDFLSKYNIDENENIELLNKPLKNAFDGFDQFYNKLLSINNYNYKYSYLTREITLYYQIGDVIVKGRFDALFKETGPNDVINRLLLIDWKTNEDISMTSFGNKKMCGPCYDLLDCNYNHYSIQLGIYDKALRETYGIYENANDITTFIVQLGKLQPDGKTLYNMLASRDVSNIVDDCILYANEQIKKVLEIN